MVTAAPLGEVRLVNIGRVNINRRSCRFPDVHYTRLRAATGVMARSRLGDCHPGVHIQGNVILRFPDSGDRLEVTCIVPSHEDLVGPQRRAEDLLQVPVFRSPLASQSSPTSG